MRVHSRELNCKYLVRYIECLPRYTRDWSIRTTEIVNCEPSCSFTKCMPPPPRKLAPISYSNLACFSSPIECQNIEVFTVDMCIRCYCSLQTVLSGMADIHSVYWSRESELDSFQWLEVMSGERMVLLSPLWKALLKHAATEFPDMWTNDR